jgi:hypothetical protein
MVHRLLHIITGEMFATGRVQVAVKRAKGMVGDVADLKKKQDKLKGCTARIMLQQTKRFRAEDFTYNKKDGSYACPAGKALEYKGDMSLRNNSRRQYKAKSGACASCPLSKKYGRRQANPRPGNCIRVGCK